MNRQLLEQPFSPEQIKQRVGNFGQTLDYVEGWAVIQRLNEAFDGQWSFQVESHEILESEVIVLGKLTAEEITKFQFGSSSVTRAKNTGEVISLADDLKSATTDSLKKCATMLGVALHLYSGVPVSTQVHKTPVIHNDPFADQGKVIYCPPTFPGRGGNGGGNGGTVSGSDGHGNNGGNGNGSSRLSQKQHSFLTSLAKERGIKINDMTKERFGCVASYLSKSEASSLIGEMTAS